MVPFKSAIKDSGLDAVEYVLSFGVGSAGVTCVVLISWLLIKKQRYAHIAPKPKPSLNGVST